MRRRRGAQVRQPAVGARSDENDVDGRALDALAFRQPHVGQRARRTLSAVPAGIAERSGTRPSMSITSPGVVPQVICGGERRDVEVERFRERRFVDRSAANASSASGRSPIASPLRRIGRVREVFERRVVGRNRAETCAELDRHVADRHATFHVERANRGSPVFDRVTDTGGNAEAADDREDHILRRRCVRAAIR